MSGHDDVEQFNAKFAGDYLGSDWVVRASDYDKVCLQLEKAKREQGELPAYLFDGYAVYQALSKKATARTSYDNVSDVLDALANLARQQPQGGEDE